MGFFNNLLDGAAAYTNGAAVAGYKQAANDLIIVLQRAGVDDETITNILNEMEQICPYDLDI